MKCQTRYTLLKLHLRTQITQFLTRKNKTNRSGLSENKLFHTIQLAVFEVILSID